MGIVLEYRPWSKRELEKSLQKYQQGIFSILDIEVSGTCNFNCMYCDSPNHKMRCTYKIENIERLVSSRNFDWFFVCGLGEPSSGKNYELLLNILKICEKYDIKCSIFSNLFILTKELIQFIDKDILHILFKFDSYDTCLNANLYGTSKKNATLQKKNIKELANHVHFNGLETNIGASIVPTRLNYKAIPGIINYCINNGIYPLVADLENSGRGQEHYSALSLSDDENHELRKSIDGYLGEKYQVPICPAVVPGLHISHDSYIVVDQISGLTCPWFWLEEPKLKRIAKLSDNTSINFIQNKVMEYRNSKLNDLKRYSYSFTKDNPESFGGCGGDIKELLTRYIDIQEQIGRKIE